MSPSLSLFHDFRAATDETARLILRNQIAEQFAPFVASVAAQACSVWKLNFQRDGADLIGEGNLALLSAIEVFDPCHEKGASFTSFASGFLARAMGRYIRNRRGLVSQRIAEKGVSVARSCDLPTHTDLDCYDQRAGEAFEGFELRSALAVAFAAVEAELSTDFERETWTRAKRALELKFVDGRGPKEIARELGETPSNVCNIITRALARLRPHLEGVWP